MKTIVLAFTLIIAGQLTAQNASVEKGAHHPPLMRMECLDLTDEQSEQLEAIRERFHGEREAILAEDKLSPEEQRDRLGELHRELDEHVRQVLTAEQYETLKEHRDHPPQHRQHSRTIRPELRRFVLDQRREFENELSSDEQARISEVREKLGSQRASFRDKRSGARRMHQHEMTAHREQVRELLETLDPIVENHREELGAIRDRIKAFSVENGNMPQGNRHGRWAEQDRPHRDPRHFLLLDADRATMDGMPLSSSETLHLYPNPAHESINIQFRLVAAGSVKLELLDQSGELLRVLVDAEHDAGKHEVPADISDLEEGAVYYVRSVISGKTSVIKFVRI